MRCCGRWAESERIECETVRRFHASRGRASPAPTIKRKMRGAAPLFEMLERSDWRHSSPAALRIVAQAFFGERALRSARRARRRCFISRKMSSYTSLRIEKPLVGKLISASDGCRR